MVYISSPFKLKAQRKCENWEEGYDFLFLLGINISKFNFVSKKYWLFLPKKLTRFRSNLVKQKSKAKIQLTPLLDLLFLNCNIFLKIRFVVQQSTSLLKNIFQYRNLTILKDYKIFNRLYAYSKKYFKKENIVYQRENLKYYVLNFKY